MYSKRCGKGKKERRKKERKEERCKRHSLRQYLHYCCQERLARGSSTAAQRPRARTAQAWRAREGLPALSSTMQCCGLQYIHIEGRQHIISIVLSAVDVAIVCCGSAVGQYACCDAELAWPDGRIRVHKPLLVSVSVPGWFGGWVA